MKKKYFYFILMILFSYLLITTYCTKTKNSFIIEKHTSIHRLPNIRPDYTDTVIPPNIAPLNFIVEEDGDDYLVKIRSSQGEEIEVFSKTRQIIIPIKLWKNLLNANRGQQIFFDVYAKGPNGEWVRFDTITNKISDSEIDGYVVYRILRLQYNFSKNLSIYQRNIQNFDERLILDNRSFEYGCINCHTFLNNQSDNMFIHLRGRPYGNRMLLVKDGVVKNVDSRTKFGLAPAAFASWHPSGRLIVFSFDKVRQFFHTARMETRDGMDLDSGLALYLVSSETIKYDSLLSDQNRLEIYPTWSPDGKYLYFSSAPRLWPPDWEKVPPERYKEVKYDLFRISYDIEKEKFGELETMLSTKETGLSITEPRISPDGRFLLFCMAEYGCFPTVNPSSDIYLLDLNTRKYKRLECNSERSDSWHCWSSNNRWIVFSSKRIDGLYMKVYFSYIDENGTSYKPFLLPQKDPTFYDSFCRLYQLPELIKEPITIGKKEFIQAIYSPQKILGEKIVTSATPHAQSILQPSSKNR